ncbi:MAG TPA: response regulator transcription factor [Polyangia bacterium]|nr:response regulator transcription factor [Polyangia bacterium]
MKVLLVTQSPDRAASEPESPGLVLRELGCDVTACDFDLALDEEALSQKPPQFVVLDARDRLESAYACLKALRERAPLAQVPALIAVTVARLPSLDFRAADDFFLVPVVPAELYARLRQLDWRLASFNADERLKVDDLHIDLAGYEVHLRDRKLELTHQEFELLKFLAQHRGKVWTREQLLSKVWGYRYFGGTRTVDIHVRRLRAKLGSPADQLIETVRNVGYKMRS